MRFAAEVMLERRGLPAPRQALRETRALDSASWHCNNAETRVSTLASLVLAVMSRREFQPSRLGAALMAMTSLASGVWILLFDDLSSVIFRQPTISEVQHELFRFFGVFLNYPDLALCNKQGIRLPNYLLINHVQQVFHTAY